MYIHHLEPEHEGRKFSYGPTLAHRILISHAVRRKSSPRKATPIRSMWCEVRWCRVQMLGVRKGSLPGRSYNISRICF
ncbi:hypothetical protein FA13DRAFT_324190 [Coprinellus micaceus]|uniref:Uncharacterized protein n=1 Tax=Coprinellus micaceus TaxID=71717 RepID=A0A4Y7SDX1_COPMI|nr:hypothetical protein FA13DRAFT_324190 [Coprinellus micaceus]